MDALDSLLHEKDFSEIGVAEIAERAGVGVASVYQRFHNRDAAVSILIALYVRRVVEWSQAAASGELGQVIGRGTLREALVQLGLSSWRQFEELRYLMRPAYLQSRLKTHLLDEHWRRQEAAALGGFHGLLTAHRDEIEHSDLERAASMIAYFYNMMFTGKLLHSGEPSSWDVPDTAEEFANELADFACGYLGVAGGVRPDDDGPESRGGHPHVA